MTTIEDEAPPVPEDRRPPATPAAPVPARAAPPAALTAPPAAPARSGRPRERAGAAVRTFQRLAWAAVLVGAVVTAFAPWGSRAWYAGWIGAGSAVLLATVAAPLRRLLTGGRRAAPLHDVMPALLLAVFAGCFAFALSGWFHEHDRDAHATSRVSATVTDCRGEADSAGLCTYHWLVDGRGYSAQEGAADQWPDGHRVSVRIDPVHPERAPMTDGGYWPLWIAVVVGALGTPLALSLWWFLTASTED
ncbi:hypothetical protein OG455_11700 [Kitasatospora sp. NBC_01287]|uniref:DUF3592 domain-containing protein n=1 Tax=Kitasatospora sp. NBC_01287 TaxID=2903573 RepID=UPI002256EFF7|nr:DUF3592 domain-containing protein [Kitasatospora sp. NBC_01287]MCX4746179.1 hypothetical protein [Kitasatospora sp. NBC_01287]